MTKKALVVDDNRINRYTLTSLLKRYGYQVIEAENGLQAVELFVEYHPTIIFMDVMMPVMDGIESCKKIKVLSDKITFVAIIFVTAVYDEDKLIDCIEAGGDDFLAKPVDLKVLTARIKSMERLSLLYDAYFAMNGRIQRDQELAKTVFNSVVISGNNLNPAIKTLLRPTETFSGDMFLSALSPSGELHILLADFTGHGLSAAIGAIPASDVFKAMTAKGFSSDKILTAINNKLNKILPTGMFMAAQYVVIRKELDYASICICGMPDIYIRDGQTQKIKRTVISHSFPLGIKAHVDFKDQFINIPLMPGDSIILCSDGVTEAVNAQGELFGEARLQALLNKVGCQPAIDCIDKTIKEFCHNTHQSDDISLAEIFCVEGLFMDEQSVFEEFDYTVVENRGLAHEQQFSLGNLSLTSQFSEHQWHWQYQLTLKGQQLAKINPVPILIGQLQELENQLENNLQSLFTILTELYINALDHGILELNSTLKNSPQGFERYFDERENKLNALNEDSQHLINFSFKGFREQEHLYIRITVEDNGKGFNIANVLNNVSRSKDTMLSGRGILLINELCHSLAYTEPGNKVEVVYTAPPPQDQYKTAPESISGDLKRSI